MARHPCRVLDAPASPTLAEILTLEPASDDTFVGRSPQEKRARVFGGQVVAQSLVAATHTTPTAHHAGGPSGDYEPPPPLGIPGPEHLPTTRFAKPGVLETRHPPRRPHPHLGPHPRDGRRIATIAQEILARAPQPG